MATEIDLYRGKLEDNLKDAAKKKRLTDFSISLAPSISIE